MAIEEKMFKINKFIPVFIMAIGVHAADTLNVFKAGDTAKAGDVNANFKFLLDQINALKVQNSNFQKSQDSVSSLLGQVADGLKKKIDSIPNSKSVYASLDSLSKTVALINSQVSSFGSKIDSNKSRIGTVKDSLSNTITTATLRSDTLQLKYSNLEKSLKSRIDSVSIQSPIAFGYIDIGGRRIGGSTNFTSGMGPGGDIICIPGIDMDMHAYPMIVTPAYLNSNPPSLVSLSNTYNGGSERCIIVEFWRADGLSQHTEFTFALFKGK